MKYILTPDIQIEKTEDNLIYVLTQQQVDDYTSEGFICKERIYKLTLNNEPVEVVGTEIWKKNDTEHSVVIPAFLVLRRRHPLEVYVYAINLYGESNISQRAAAEATKEEFGLKTFSHTTIGRAMRTLAETLEKYNQKYNDSDNMPDTFENGIENTATEAKNNVALVTMNDVIPEYSVKSTAYEQTDQCKKQKSDELDCTKTFPTVKDTRRQRELIRSFFEGKLNIHIRQGLRKACERIAVWWYTQFSKLLI